ncbi:Lrp/AsnC family transcriptional regulator [Desulfopila aestuarii]|uniref:Lrp/AsnC family transcriptional regulator, regulator for asnA, asnC and gidA n=1 Tax=Desulfopila aestuarii DSM 18488 TaxID=1121416 RepID=A0A1M7Y8X7_9BACT|nr:Lrp/AsnC family transcriptional regulator [Desulfopila aestuarii]SHO49006.1 Lrp/AsnC family transcriptional regulator, regulator for asnA, asnC and gidA [Desulfopila aestuarii DSM 18488]
MYIDEINLAIIRHLKDGRVPFKKIADDLGVSEGTVRTRVKKLTDEGVLDIAGLVDPEAIPDLGVVLVGVKVKDMDLVKKGEEFSKLKGVTSVCVVTGRYDLIVTVLLTRDFTMLRFYTDEVSTIDKVQSVESFVVYKSFNLKLPMPLT